MQLHPDLIRLAIIDATAGTITRRKPRRNWPWATVALVSLCALAVVLAGGVSGQGA